MLNERLALVVTLDADGAIKGLNNVGRAADRNLGKVDSKLDKTAHRMQKAGVGMMAAAGLAATGLYKAGQAAADLEQSVGGTEAVFGDAGKAIDKYAKTAATKMGLSERAFREATTRIGGQLKGVGFDIDEAADKSIELTGIAADLAATFGGTTADAVDALGAAFRGEADPAERFNLRLNQTTVNAKAVEMGLAASTAEVDANAKAQATLALITEQSADAQGQFAREADTAAGSMQIATASIENAKAELGQAVAPILADVASKAAGLASGLSTLNEESGGLVSTLATYGTIGLGAAGGISFVTGKVIELREQIHTLKGAKGNLAALGTVTLGLVAAWELYGQTMAEAKAAGAGAADGLRDLFKNADPATVTMEQLNREMRNLQDQILANDEAIRGSQAPWDADRRAQMKAANEAGRELRDEWARLGYAAEDLARSEGITEDAALRLILANEDLTASATDAAGGFDTEAAATAGLVQELKDLEDALNAQFDPLFGLQSSLDDLRQAQWDAAVATKEHGAKSAEAREANRKATEAAVDYQSKLLGLKGAIEAGDVSIDNAIGTLDAWVDQGIITKEQARLVAGEFRNLGDRAANLDGKRVVITADANTAPAQSKLNALIASARSISMGLFSWGGGGGVGRANGGPIYRAGGGPSGTDTVPAWLTPGEFVMQKSAVDRLGMSAMSAINQGQMPTAGGGGVVINVQSIDPRTAGRVVLDALKSAESQGLLAGTNLSVKR